MSRSHKKTAVIKDANPYMKTLCARKVRYHAKQILHVFKTVWQTGDDPIFPHRNSLVNQWDVCDWRHFIDVDDEDELWGRHWFRKRGVKYLRK